MWMRIVAAMLLAAALAACGGSDQPDHVEWRNIGMDLPDGWYLFEETDTRLSISNQPLGTSADPTEIAEAEDVVAMFLTFEPGVLPGDWREFVDEQDATIETDDEVIIGEDVPATRLVFAYESNGVPTREMVVVIPSREVVVLAQPVPYPDERDAPEVFLRYIDTFMEVIESMDPGAPVRDD